MEMFHFDEDVAVNGGGHENGVEDSGGDWRMDQGMNGHENGGSGRKRRSKNSTVEASSKFGGSSRTVSNGGGTTVMGTRGEFGNMNIYMG